MKFKNIIHSGNALCDFSASRRTNPHNQTPTHTARVLASPAYTAAGVAKMGDAEVCIKLLHCCLGQSPQVPVSPLASFLSTPKLLTPFRQHFCPGGLCVPCCCGGDLSARPFPSSSTLETLSLGQVFRDICSAHTVQGHTLPLGSYDI